MGSDGQDFEKAFFGKGDGAAELAQAEAGNSIPNLVLHGKKMPNSQRSFSSEGSEEIKENIVMTKS